MKQYYRRRLPHWQPPGATIFVTYRLFGSLPARVLDQLADEEHRLKREPLRPGESSLDRSTRIRRHIHGLTERALDTIRTGPQYLAHSTIATIVADNLFEHMDRLYRLWAFVVMTNHVHILIEPLAVAAGSDTAVALSRIMHSLKSYTATKANGLLGRRGAFWQDESYDHWIRNAAESSRVVEYIEQNPVKAGLVAAADDWPWSSASFDRGQDGACSCTRISE